MLMQSLRKQAGGWVAKVLLLLLVVSFGIWGIADVFQGRGDSALARVGEQTIDVEAFRQAYQRETQFLSRRLNQPLSPDDARALGLDRSVLSRLVQQAALDARLAELGIGVTQETVAARLAAEPVFQGPDGRFDRLRFDDYLRTIGLPEPLFLEEQRRDMARQQFTESIAAGLAPPTVFGEALARYDAESRSVEVLGLPASAAGEDPGEPDEGALRTFYGARSSLFAAPEYRKFTVLTLTPELLAERQTIPDERVRTFYDQNRATRFTRPERRTIERIPFPTEADAAAAAARLASGEITFEALAGERSVGDSDRVLGTFTKAQIIDQALGEAVFALAPDTVSGVIKGTFGPVIAKVTAVEPETVEAFEAVSDRIRRDLALVEARKLRDDVQDRVEDERAGGGTLAEIGPKVGLEAVAIEAADAQGRTPEGTEIALPRAGEVLRAVFRTEVGTEVDPLNTRDGATIWFEVQGVTPARERPFEEVREQVRAAYLEDARAQRLAEKANAIVSRVQAGEPFESMAAAEGQPLQTFFAVTRNDTQTGLPAAVVARLFTTPEGGLASVATDDGGRAIVRVTGITVPPFDPATANLTEPLRQAGRAMAENVVSQYVSNLEKSLGVTINQALLRSVVGGVEP